MYTDTLPMCLWAAEDLPSVKAEVNGYKCLTNAELLSIIIGSGTANENALELSRKILMSNDNSIKNLGMLKLEQLEAVKGIGKKKALKILAAIELGNRMKFENGGDDVKISNAMEAYRLMRPKMYGLPVEEFWVILLKNNGNLIKTKRISLGGMTETPVDIRVIMKEAVLSNAVSIIACHNHPSGSLKPSRCDDELTLSIKRACDIMKLHLTDHVIVTDTNYYSYQENGKL